MAVDKVDLLSLALLVSQMDLNIAYAELNGKTPLLYVTQDTTMDCIGVLIAAGADVSLPGWRGHSPLYHAVSNMEKKCIKMFMDYGADATHCVAKRYIPLHRAALLNDCDSILLFIGAGAHVDGKCRDNHTALHHALKAGNEEATNVLIQAGANIHNINRYTPLEMALSWKSWKCAKLLIEAGVDPSINSALFHPPLHIICEHGDLDLLKAILDVGVDVNIQHPHTYDTALHIAARHARLEAIQLLLSYGADVRLVDKYGDSARRIIQENKRLNKHLRDLYPHIFT